VKATAVSVRLRIFLFAFKIPNTRRGRRYDPDHDRSTSLEPPGPRVFSEAIRRAKFPTRFRQPANLTKYSGETNPELWLADYRLAC